MSIRVERVASVIKHELGAILSREYNSPEYGFITVTEVHITADLKLAKIYVSILGKNELRDKTLKMLESKKKHIRSLVGSNIRLKYTPDIQFYIDETLDRVDNINKIIKKIHENDTTDRVK
ncbi:MAG: 30S ribosome-binding factor RbfA [Bacteroidota bacterium]|nr:30S ribosome-binding factor RbfA [Bacteroidota bacterium]